MTHRDHEGERRTHTHLARDPDPPSVEFYKLPTQGKPQPGALHLLVRCPHLAKLLDHAFLTLWVDANPCIADRDLASPVLWRGLALDPPTFRRELDCMRQQVQYARPALSPVPRTL